MMGHQDFMRLAIDLAVKAERRPGLAPIGCVIVLDNKVVATGVNEVALRNDPTAHAEMVAIRRAAASLGTTALRGATLYTTLQPCGMCTMAAIWARIGAIVFGAQRHQVHAMYFEDRHLDTIDFINDAFRDDLPVMGGVQDRECARLYFGPDDTIPADEQGNI